MHQQYQRFIHLVSESHPPSVPKTPTSPRRRQSSDTSKLRRNAGSHESRQDPRETRQRPPPVRLQRHHLHSQQQQERRISHLQPKKRLPLRWPGVSANEPRNRRRRRQRRTLLPKPAAQEAILPKGVTVTATQTRTKTKTTVRMCLCRLHHSNQQNSCQAPMRRASYIAFRPHGRPCFLLPPQSCVLKVCPQDSVLRLSSIQHYARLSERVTRRLPRRMRMVQKRILR